MEYGILAIVWHIKLSVLVVMNIYSSRYKEVGRRNHDI